MIDLFGVSWADLGFGDVRAFLDDAGDEGVTWEAKADDERGRLHPDSLAKAACGLANVIGGYILIGAKQEKKGGPWSLPGITPPGDEATVWIGKVIRGLNPTPNHVPKPWTLDDGRLVAVVRIDPVDEPPCMTRRGQVYERVSGETIPVEDPARLDALFRRGEHARGRADDFAERAALRALKLPEWRSTRAVGIGIGLAPIGRETDDISSRLFVQPFADAVLVALGRFVTGGLGPFGRTAEPDLHLPRTQQDAFGMMATLDERHVTPGTGAYPQPRSAWMLQATWDGAVAASVMLTPDAVEQPIAFEHVLRAGLREIVPLVQRLGGYGPARLTVAIDVAPDVPSTMPVTEDGVSIQAPPPPPKNSLYARLGKHTRMSRSVTVAEPDPELFASLQRELHRAAGHWQPEDEPSASA